ncbi:MAG: 2-oxo acid dehydrogenase subunit E2 [Planctomycetaceae bacterium]|nr:2-oxo acid dehydrogenase subunit E2 [Planctomycetaceae bacterium]
MARDVKLPKLGQTMEEGTVVNTLVKIGDAVKKGDILFEVETDKATLEVESPADGSVRVILVENGETIAVNTPILVLGDANEQIDPAWLSGLKSGKLSEGQAAAQAAQTPAPAPMPSAAPAAAFDASGVSASIKLIRLPKLGQTMEEGTIVNALYKVGDTVKKGEVLFEVETDKATLEVESPADGQIKAILVETGQTLAVNEPLLVIAPADEPLPAGLVDSLIHAGPTPAETVPSTGTGVAPAAITPPLSKGQVAAPAAGGVSPAPAEKLFATPRAKIVAAELGIDLRNVTAANALRIVEADIRRAASASVGAGSHARPGTAAAPGSPSKYQLGQRIALNRLQKIVAERMLWSKQNIPCFYLNVQVDATALFALRAKLNKSRDVKLSFNDFIIRALAEGIKHYPILTGQLDGDAIRLAPQIDIGLAIATDDGLVAPIVKDCGQMDLYAINRYSLALIERARANKLSLDDLTGGCTTVSNLGGFGIDSFIPIVVPGQATILGVGAITDTVVPMDGNLMIRKMMNLTLSVDHKVINGAEAAQFLDYVKKLLESPNGLI